MNLLKLVSGAVGGLPGTLISEVVLKGLGKSKNSKVADAANSLNSILESSNDNKVELKIAEMDLQRKIEDKLIEELKLKAKDADIDIIGEQRGLAEAQSESFFIAGGRPALLWIVNITLTINYIIFPMYSYFTGTEAKIFLELPDQLYWLYGSVVLGVSGMRTYEKLVKMGSWTNKR